MKETKENGITLIALIITIIVMLILVGVTVNVALNGGLFDTAKKASNETQVSEEKEIIQVAYSDYQMQKYSLQKTEDFDILETYFLGQEKQGVNLNELLDYEENIDGISYYHFKNIDIVVTENDIELIEEEDYVFMNFEYNNHKYKLTFNGNTAITQKLEVEPTLQLQDAIVSEESYGWSILFNTSTNTYDLLIDGTILSNTWWKITDSEYSQMKNDTKDSGLYLIAKNENVTVGLTDTSNKSVVIVDNNIVYYFVVSDADLEEIGLELSTFKWYCVEMNGTFVSDIKEHEGTSPINLDDFTDEQIYCRTYLERVIESFNQ